MPNLLLDFPPDVFLSIIGYLDFRSCAQLRLVCKDLHSIASATCLKNILIDLTQRGRFDPGFNSRLSYCSTALTGLHAHTQHIAIRANYFYAGRHIFPDILPQLWENITMMKALRSLTVKLVGAHSGLNHSEGERLLDECLVNVGRAVVTATRGQLKKLVLELAPSSHIPESFLELRELEELEYRLGSSSACMCTPTRGGLCLLPSNVQRLQSIIHANPNLVRLTLWNGCRRAFLEMNRLSEVVSRLESLDISGIKCPTIISNGLPCHSLSRLRRLTIRSPVDQTTFDELWVALSRTAVQLDYLDTSQVTLPLLNYLSSFYGLRHLSMLVVPQNLPRSAASAFFHSTLPNHSHTLVYLSISLAISDDSEWCYTPSLWDSVLHSMPALKTLSLNLRPLVVPSSSDYLSCVAASCQEILDCVIGIRCLHYLKIHDRESVTWGRAIKRVRGSKEGKPRTLGLYCGTYLSEVRAGEERCRYRKI